MQSNYFTSSYVVLRHCSQAKLSIFRVVNMTLKLEITVFLFYFDSLMFEPWPPRKLFVSTYLQRKEKRNVGGNYLKQQLKNGNH